MSNDCCGFCTSDESGCAYKKIKDIPDCCGVCSYSVQLDHTQIRCGLPDMDLSDDGSYVGALYICGEFIRMKGE